MSKKQLSRRDSISQTVKGAIDYVCQRLRVEIFRIESATGLTSLVKHLGDLTKKKIYPTLWWLYRDGFLPECIRFIGYIRSQITIEKIFENAAKYMKVQENECEIYEKFVQLNTYIAGLYDNRQDFEHLNVEANKLSQ
ncbi:unnamed protein product [Rotaria sordida]|uniref:glucose-6-phosphate dehydrogenase (NADP(+)) n=1 Tax=Rotaria sordida TaxID=392033 RepID=A0A815QL78_9BILA|nr:unnamed protein product [Rotaria sordida]CAF1464607.1 unnamed protein product [Rotaria sordida]CAF3702390.1 unnamed protein product [Rotaria sordida]CAF3925296.1 unnamed protein product [Rotaria sordida]